MANNQKLLEDLNKINDEIKMERGTKVSDPFKLPDSKRVKGKVKRIKSCKDSEGITDGVKRFKHDGKKFEQLTSSGFNARGAAARSGRMGSHFWARDAESGKRVLMHSRVLETADDVKEQVEEVAVVADDVPAGDKSQATASAKAPPFYAGQFVSFTDTDGHYYSLQIKEVTQSGGNVTYKCLIVMPKEKSGQFMTLNTDDVPRMTRTTS